MDLLTNYLLALKERSSSEGCQSLDRKIRMLIQVICTTDSIIKGNTTECLSRRQGEMAMVYSPEEEPHSGRISRAFVLFPFKATNGN